MRTAGQLGALDSLHRRDLGARGQRRCWCTNRSDRALDGSIAAPRDEGRVAEAAREYWAASCPRRERDGRLRLLADADGLNQVGDRLGERLADVLVDQAPVLVEALGRLPARDFVGERACADGGEDFAQLGLGPDSTEGARRGADDSRWLRSGFVATGRETQSSAFFSTPGMDALYSGVAMRTASAPATAERSSATVAGASGPSSSWS